MPRAAILLLDAFLALTLIVCGVSLFRFIAWGERTSLPLLMVLSLMVIKTAYSHFVRGGPPKPGELSDFDIGSKEDQ